MFLSGTAVYSPFVLYHASSSCVFKTAAYPGSAAAAAVYRTGVGSSCERQDTSVASIVQ